MKEIIEFRIFDDYYHLLSKPNNAVFNGAVYVIKVEKGDRIFEEIKQLSSEVKQKYNKYFFGYSNIKRQYSKKELAAAALLQMKIRTTFEPSGEECGTLYDETAACEICGANRKQISPLILKKGSIPKKDIARTISGEVVVSERFAEVIKQRNLKGIELEPVLFGKEVSNYYQLIASSPELKLTDKTIAGGDIFDLGPDVSDEYEFIVSGGHKVKFENEVYRCPKGHIIGLNLLSEPYVTDSPLIKEFDFFASKQKIGVKRGLLRPEPIYFCSQAFRKMIEEEKLTGFEFEIANIE